jgi:hypothetical protein
MYAEPLGSSALAQVALISSWPEQLDLLTELHEVLKTYIVQGKEQLLNVAVIPIARDHCSTISPKGCMASARSIATTALQTHTLLTRPLNASE